MVPKGLYLFLFFIKKRFALLWHLTFSLEEIKEHQHIEVADEIDKELEKLLQTDIFQGLRDEEVQERLLQFGKNGKNRFCMDTSPFFNKKNRNA
jgi:hypothetical protein